MVYLMKQESLALCCMWTAAKGDVCVYNRVSDINPLIVLTASGLEAKLLS